MERFSWCRISGVRAASNTCILLFFLTVSLGIDVDELRVNWHLPDTLYNKKEFCLKPA
jgi:hypothetical protein